MNDQIKVNYQVLDQMAESLKNAANKSKNALDELLSVLRKYDEDFTGSAKEAFNDLDREYRNVTEVLVPELTTLANKITDSGATFNKTDLAAADGFR